MPRKKRIVLLIALIAICVTGYLTLFSHQNGPVGADVTFKFEQYSTNASGQRLATFTLRNRGPASILPFEIMIVPIKTKKISNELLGDSALGPSEERKIVITLPPAFNGEAFNLAYSLSPSRFRFYLLACKLHLGRHVPRIWGAMDIITTSDHGGEWRLPHTKK